MARLVNRVIQMLYDSSAMRSVEADYIALVYKDFYTVLLSKVIDLANRCQRA